MSKGLGIAAFLSQAAVWISSVDKTSCDCNPLAIDWVLYLAGLPQPSRAELLHPAPLLKAAALQQPQAYSLQVPSEVRLWLTINIRRMLNPWYHR